MACYCSTRRPVGDDRKPINTEDPWRSIPKFSLIMIGNQPGEGKKNELDHSVIAEVHPAHEVGIDLYLDAEDFEYTQTEARRV
jgi:hypothetical protein